MALKWERQNITAKKTKKAVWPEIARRLDDYNICTEPYQINKECGCLMKWTDELAVEVTELTHPDSLVNSTNELNKTYSKILWQIRHLLIRELGYSRTVDDMPEKHAEIARGWNRMIRKLGDTIPCEL